MKHIQWSVEGMDCTNCALTISRYLEKQGLKNVKVNFGTGDVSFDSETTPDEKKISAGIASLGYTVADLRVDTCRNKVWYMHLLATPFRRFLFCLPFAVLLNLHMIASIPLPWLHDPRVQLALTLPVFLIGMRYFGRSAWKGIRNGIPNMNVLITIGATAALLYSIYGFFADQPMNFMFYDTTATIITLVFLGNWLEDASVASTQRALNKLARSQKVMANMIGFDEEFKEHIHPIENTQLRVGDLILIRSGEQVPMDCKILWGEVQVDESIITGESMPVQRSMKGILIGGSTILDGSVKAQVTAIGEQTVLSGIIRLMKQAQGEKPPVQQLADRISAVFVPVVLGIALLTLFINWVILKEFTPSLMRSIAVLVIACPCAMGLATPAAIAVGLGRAAREGILFRNATSLELFKGIRQVVFDKTGTLTTGQFVISGFHTTIDEQAFKNIVCSLEKYSNHPLARSIVSAWRSKVEVRWKNIEEIKGAGVSAEDKEGNRYRAGSYKIAGSNTQDALHNIYVTLNEKLIGWIDLKDEVRPEASSVIHYLHKQRIKTILLSGDTQAKAKLVGEELGIDTVIAEQSPEEKLNRIVELNKESPVAMVGDGINDAPALAKATIGISVSDASHLAMQSAQVVLINNGLKNLPEALGLGKHTFLTIKQNLVWAFLYNVIAIPVAALGFLHPGISALAMGFSDVILAVNSGRLFVKKVT
jgi:P-type Cu+ transporter